MVKASEVKTSSEYEIIDVVAEGFVRERLLELGIVPGRLLRIVHRLPFVGPVVVQVGTTFVALRADEAEKVWLKPL